MQTQISVTCFFYRGAIPVLFIHATFVIWLALGAKFAARLAQQESGALSSGAAEGRSEIDPCVVAERILLLAVN